MVVTAKVETPRHSTVYRLERKKNASKVIFDESTVISAIKYAIQDLNQCKSRIYLSTYF